MRYLSKAMLRRERVGRRLRARLHEVRRVVDHRRRGCAGWRSRNCSTACSRCRTLLLIDGPRSSGHMPHGPAVGRDLRIVDPDRRHLARILGMVLARTRMPRGGTPAAAKVAWISRSDSWAARAFGVSVGNVDGDGAGALAHPVLRHPHHVGALLRGQAAAAAADEHHDRAVGLGDRDRMTLAIIGRRVHHRDSCCRRRAGRRRASRRGRPARRRGDAAPAIGGCSGCGLCHRPPQSVMKP